jgi:hypothetical protein
MDACGVVVCRGTEAFLGSTAGLEAGLPTGPGFVALAAGGRAAGRASWALVRSGAELTFTITATARIAEIGSLDEISDIVAP